MYASYSSTSLGSTVDVVWAKPLVFVKLAAVLADGASDNDDDFIDDAIAFCDRWVDLKTNLCQPELLETF